MDIAKKKLKSPKKVEKSREKSRLFHNIENVVNPTQITEQCPSTELWPEIRAPQGAKKERPNHQASPVFFVKKSNFCLMGEKTRDRITEDPPPMSKNWSETQTPRSAR